MRVDPQGSATGRQRDTVLQAAFILNLLQSQSRSTAVRPVSALLVIFLTLFAPLCAAFEVEGIRLWRAPDHTRVVLDLSGAAPHQFFSLANPDRVVVDLQATVLSVATELVDVVDSPIKTIRSASRRDGDLRLVFDVGHGVTARSFLLAANRQYGDRLVIDFFPPETAAVKVKSLPQRSAKRDIIVALDAGHGGEDPGALGPKKIREKTVVLAIAQAVKKQIDRRSGYRAVLVRKGDYYVGLNKRRDIAREHRADLFISIHADAFTDKRVNGSSVYTLSQSGASSASAKFLAESENRTDLMGGVDLASKDDVLAGVLLDLSMTAKLDASEQAAREILRELGAVAKLHKRRVEHAGFAVLKSPDMPSVLIETGFISNPAEARRLSSRRHQEKIATAIVRGAVSYFDQHAAEDTLVHWASRRGVVLNDGGGSSAAVLYKIKYGDTLSQLAERFSVPLAELRRYNALGSDKIRVGQTLKIPSQK